MLKIIIKKGNIKKVKVVKLLPVITLYVLMFFFIFYSFNHYKDLFFKNCERIIANAINMK